MPNTAAGAARSKSVWTPSRPDPDFDPESGSGRGAAVFLLPQGEGRRAGHPPIVSIFRATNPLTSLIFQKMQRHQPAIGRPAAILPPSRRTGGSLGRRSEAAAGADGAGVRRCKPGEPDRRRGLLRVACPGWRTGGDTQVVPGIGIVARPARRRRCGKAITPPPDASFRKTSRAERLSFAETVFLSAHPGEGPGAPPCLPPLSGSDAGKGFSLREAPGRPRVRPPVGPRTGSGSGGPEGPTTAAQKNGL